MYLATIGNTLHVLPYWCCSCHNNVNRLRSKIVRHKDGERQAGTSDGLGSTSALLVLTRVGEDFRLPFLLLRLGPGQLQEIRWLVAFTPRPTSFGGYFVW
mmetsp:Transcript_49464/g.107476  ORF Transcript_49464/g.107476 Transcript_49464/m.107476 type:complete len:100 (-) Transcript_49464:476-775(-)